MAETISKSLSMKGWSFSTLLKKNSTNIKALIIFLSGYSYFVSFDAKVFIAGLLVILAKFATDSIDFYLSEVDLTE